MALESVFPLGPSAATSSPRSARTPAALPSWRSPGAATPRAPARRATRPERDGRAGATTDIGTPAMHATEAGTRRPRGRGERRALRGREKFPIVPELAGHVSRVPLEQSWLQARPRTGSLSRAVQ